MQISDDAEQFILTHTMAEFAEALNRSTMRFYFSDYPGKDGVPTSDPIGKASGLHFVERDGGVANDGEIIIKVTRTERVCGLWWRIELPDDNGWVSGTLGTGLGDDMRTSAPGVPDKILSMSFSRPQ